MKTPPCDEAIRLHLPGFHPEGIPPELEATFIAVRTIPTTRIPGVAESLIALDTTTKNPCPLLIPPVIRAIAFADVLRRNHSLSFSHQLAVGVCGEGPPS